MGNKILFMYNVCGLGGVETSIINRLSAFQRLDLDTRLLFQSYWGEGGKILARNPALYMHEDERTQRAFIEDWAPDCIVVVDWPRFVDVVARSQARCPLIFETHMSDPIAFKKRRIIYGIEHPRVSMVAVPSRFNRSILIEHSVDASRIKVIPNAIDHDRFNARHHAPAHHMFGLSDASPLILFVGRLEPQKNAIEFVQIFKELLKLEPRCRAVIVGTAVDTQEYEQVVREEATPIIHRTTFLPHVSYEEMPAIYEAVARSGGCLLSTSLHESQPMIILEAMASNCPVVTSDVGGVAEIVRDGFTGHLYRLGDVNLATELVKRIVTERELRAKTTEAAKQYVNTRHSLWKAAESYQELFREIGVLAAACSN